MTSISTKSETNDDPEEMSESTALTATLYLRSAPSGPAIRRQRALRDRFEALGDDVAGERQVERWARTVTTPVEADEEAPGAALDRYRAFDVAVSEAGGRLEPFFQVRDRSSGLLVGGPSEEVITFPVCCLAVTRGESVTGLYPCWLEGAHHSVEEGIDALADGTAENLA